MAISLQNMSLKKTGFFYTPIAAIIVFLINGPSLALAHSADYWYGYNIGKQDGNGGI
jgi:hypothetical protein